MGMEKKKKTSRSNVIIPDEIVFEIMTRLPVKSLSRFRCVSKRWNSTISDDRRFVELHHNRSLTRPGGTTLFITFPEGKGNEYARSIYAVLDHDHHQFHHHHREEEEEEEENEEDQDVAVHQLYVPGFLTSYVSHSLHGLICLVQDKFIMICNPSTCAFIALPPTTQSNKTSHFDPRSYLSNVTLFGYDPVNNQHKVLNTRCHYQRMITEHRVFVLGGVGASSSSWRGLVDVPPHFPRRMDDVCFNGAIYYRAFTSMVEQCPWGAQVLVEFDVRLETFRFIQLPNGASLQPLEADDVSALVQFDGHLALVDYQHLKNANTLDIWILEDSLKPTWVHKTIVFSSAAWTDFLEENQFFLSGTIRTGEIIIAPHTIKQPFYLFYLDLKKLSARRVKISSLPCTSRMRLGGGYYTVTVTDHVENILSLSHLM